MEQLSTTIFLSDSSDCLGCILSNRLREKGYALIDNVDFESNVVIHNAEMSEYNLQKKDGTPFNRVNFLGTKALCEAIDKWFIKPKAFIYFSSVSVYGSKGGELISENHPLNGTSAYAESKIMAEDFLIEWAYKSKITLCILRLPKIIADKRFPGSLGKMIETIRSGNYISIGNGRSRQSALWVEDIVTLIPKIPEIEGIYNLTDGYHPSFIELESLICKVLNKDRPFRIPYLIAKPLAWIGDIVGGRFSLNSNKLEEITNTLTFDDQKARKTFDWKPSSILEKMTLK